jgi:hypothetical protein
MKPIRGFLATVGLDLTCLAFAPFLTFFFAGCGAESLFARLPPARLHPSQGFGSNVRLWCGSYVVTIAPV